MTETRAFRVGFLATLWGAIGVVVIVTAWALWPTFVEWWSVRSLIEKLKVALMEENASAFWSICPELNLHGSIVVPALLDLSKDSTLIRRSWAIGAIRELKDDAVKPAIPAVIKALEDEDWTIRQTACSVFREHPKIATAAIPALRERLLDRDEDDKVRLEAFHALLELEGLNSEWRQGLPDPAEQWKNGERDWMLRKIKEMDAEAPAEAGGRVPAGDE